MAIQWFFVLMPASLLAMQMDDYPMRVSIDITAYQPSMDTLQRSEEKMNPVLERFGYKMIPNTGDHGDFSLAVYNATKDGLPRHLVITYNSDSVSKASIVVYTKGEAKDGVYTGHDDDVTFAVCKLIKPLVNPSR